MDLWTLPFGSPALSLTTLDMIGSAQCMGFSYHVETKQNKVNVRHQSCCNPQKMTLDATRLGFLVGMPHIDVARMKKYLAPSQETAKWHVQCQQQGLCST
jgi:hypothetical protein